MRIYLISDNKEKEIALANIIGRSGHSAVMSELDSGSYGDMVGEALDSLKSGYDMIVMVSSDSVNANIEANKTGKLRAYACSTADDSAKAMRAGVNVIVIDASASRGALNGIMSGLMGAPAAQQPVQKQAPAAKPVQSKPVQAKRPANDLVAQQEDEPAPPKESGIMKKLKYHFGLD